MKTRLLLSTLLVLVAATTAHAALFYSGVQNVAVPVTLDGAYLRMSDGATTGTFPADWSTAPWLNPFFGGVDIANSPLLRPVITGTDQILNLAAGTPINGTSNFVAGESGSSTHVGAGAGQFALGAPGIIGLAFETSVGGPDLYGWVRVIINNISPGIIVDWAYENTPGVGINAGQIAPVPEPEQAARILLFALPGVSLLFRCRRRRSLVA